MRIAGAQRVVIVGGLAALSWGVWERYEGRRELIRDLYYIDPPWVPAAVAVAVLGGASLWALLGFRHGRNTD